MMSNLKTMIKNYFLITIRSFWKNRATSIIKIAGLAIGLSVVFLIHIYTSFQYSYDNYHKNGDRIYRVAYHFKNPNIGKWDDAKTGNNLASMLQNDFPEIETTSRIAWLGGVNILHKDQPFVEMKFLFADPSVLKIFSFPMKAGDRETALNEQKSIIVSSKIAKKYFGDENPIGKFLGDNLQLKVTGIIDVPDNSHFRFDILASYSTIYDIFPDYRNKENDDHSSVYTYLMLRKDANFSDLEKKFPQFVRTNIKSDLFYTSPKLFLEPLKEIQLNSSSESNYGEMNVTKHNKRLISIFSILGLIIIGVASFNFINISIAHISGRIKEVSVRKVYGAKNAEIFFQFVCEYGLYSLLAVLISIFIVQAFLPFICSILDRQIKINFLEYSVAATSVMLLVTVFAGAYPSFIVAKVNPVNALQSGFKGPRGNLLRSVLIVSQFTVSIIILLTTVYVSKQIKHLTEMDMGLNTKDLLVVDMNHPKIRGNYEMLKSELLRNPDILSVSASSNIPAVSGVYYLTMKIDEGEEMSFPFISIDSEFTKNLGIKTIDGRSFIPDLQADIRSTFLLNKSAVKQLRIENPVGKSLFLFRDENGSSVPVSSGQIVGIIDDYAYRPTYDDSKGVIFRNDPGRFNAMFIRIDPIKQKETMTFLKDTWGKLFREIPLSVNYLEDEIKNDIAIQVFYKVQRFIIAVAFFSFFIALLGLFGISILTAKQRVKEIGIRRVNGASLFELLILMNRKFINMVLLSIVLGFPIVYLILEEIKKESAKSTSLSIFNYVIAFLIILTLSILTVSWQSWKAATRNPVEALRYE